MYICWWILNCYGYFKMSLMRWNTEFIANDDPNTAWPLRAKHFWNTFQCTTPPALEVACVHGTDPQNTVCNWVSGAPSAGRSSAYCWGNVVRSRFVMDQPCRMVTISRRSVPALVIHVLTFSSATASDPMRCSFRACAGSMRWAGSLAVRRNASSAAAATVIGKDSMSGSSLMCPPRSFSFNSLLTASLFFASCLSL